jgi:Glycosyl transferases group 1
MVSAKKNKFIIVDPSQKDQFSHNYQYNRIIARSALESGFDVTVMTHIKDKSEFSDIGVNVERIFPHSLYDYDGTHDHWHNIFWRKVFHAGVRLQNLYSNLPKLNFFETFPDALLLVKMITRIMIMLLSPLIYVGTFLRNRIIYKQMPYHRDLFAEIVARKFRNLALGDNDHVVMHSATFGALEAFLSIRALSNLKQPYSASFTAIFHHSLDEPYAHRYWYMEYYQRSELNSLARRWEIGSPFKQSRFLALSQQLVAHLGEKTSLPFAHFHHIADQSAFAAVFAAAPLAKSTERFRVGIRASDISSKNSDMLIENIRRLKGHCPQLAVSIFNRGHFLSSREAFLVAAAGGNYNLVDTTETEMFLKGLQSVDALILPYDRTDYKHRISAVLYEAAMLGVDVVVPDRTTLAAESGSKVHAYEDAGEAGLAETLLRLSRQISIQAAERPIDSAGGAIRDRLLRNVVKTDFTNLSTLMQTLPYGPVAAIVSPFWGKCGSTTVFDSETEYLLDRGYYTARFMVIQWRVIGNSTQYIYDVLRENVDRVRPHVFLFSSPQRRNLILLRLSRVFRSKSALGQDAMRLGLVTEHDRPLSKYFFDEAQIAIVNHSFHGEYLKRFRKAKVILETQDIQALQYEIRNEKNRMSGKPERIDQWMRDEAEVWRRVDACVNLSPDEQATIQQYQPNSHFVLPMVNEKEPKSVRDWPKYCLDNNIHESVGLIESFDFLLWGDYHPSNIASTRWFIDKVVMPRVIPDLKTLVVGRVGHQMYHIFGSTDQLWCGGFVDSLDEAVLRSKILILPDQMGSGVSIKTMDTLALQRPFVATALALRSLNLGDGRFKGCETLEEFIADCKLLLKSEKARKERVKIAKYLYDLNFSREQYYQKWDKVLESVGISTGRAAS